MKNIYPILFLITILTACSPYGYVNQMPVEPMFTQKNEGKVNASAGFNHAEIQAAYSATKNFGFGINSYLGETYGYTASLQYYTPLTENLYFGLQSGFGEQKMKYNIKVPFYTTYKANIYYSSYHLQPSLYLKSKNTGNKIGLLYKFGVNNFNSYHLQDFYNYGARSNNYKKYNWDLIEPQNIACHTVLFVYEKSLKNPKYFMQIQMGYAYLKNMKVKYDQDINNINSNLGTGINHNYEIHFSPFIFNMTFGINLGMRRPYIKENNYN